MADAEEIFFDTIIDEEGGPRTLHYVGDDHDDHDDHAFWSSVLEDCHPNHIVLDEFEEEDDVDGDLYLGHHSREDYDVAALSSVFTHDFAISNPPFGSGISLEDDSESSLVEEEGACGIDLDDRRFQRRSVDGVGGMDADGDLLDLMGLGSESDYNLDVGLGEGLGLGYGLDVEEHNFDDDVDCGVLEGDQVDALNGGVDGFFFGCGSERSATGYDCDEARSEIVGYESESESVDEQVTLGGEELSRSSAYDSELDFEDGQATVDSVQASDWSGVDLGQTYTVEPRPAGDVRRERNSEFEWEEVDGRDEEGEVLQMASVPSPHNYDWLAREVADIESEDHEEAGDLGWDLFLLLNNINTEQEGDPYGQVDHEAFVHPSEYEELFAQLADQETVINGSPPAATRVVEKLPSIVVTEDDPTMRDIACAVCKDEIPPGMTVKQLPCKHHYHADCILPWLEMRNTCPICRYELPTDDPDYERCKARENTVAHRFQE